MHSHIQGSWCLPLAATTYSRIRFAQQLFPLLIAGSQATALAQVIDVAAGTKERDVDTTDLQIFCLSHRHV